MSEKFDQFTRSLAVLSSEVGDTETRRSVLRRAAKLGGAALAALGLSKVGIVDVEAAQNYYVQGNALRCRSCAYTTCGVLDYFYCGDQVRGGLVAGQWIDGCVTSTGWWLQTTASGGATCYVSLAYLHYGSYTGCCAP